MPCSLAKKRGISLDAVLAGEKEGDLSHFPLDGLRLAVPQTLVFDGIDSEVARAFAAAQSKLSAAGVRISDIALREFSELARINSKGGFAAVESYAFHRLLIAAKRDLYDLRVLSRIMRGSEQDAADYIDLVSARNDFSRRVRAVTAPYDALLMPTVPIVAPRLRDLQSEEDYGRINLSLLRNPTLANFLDGCSISIPCHQHGDAPVGLMLIGQHGDDARLLAIAGAIESVVAPQP
jgi:aspartyl-tRNA(Asn)/glutamyl-tRNA(Gln) amidotransferase subunit A